jgi:ferredoxin-NADP reductase
MMGMPAFAAEPGNGVGRLLRSRWLHPLNDLDSIDELIAPFAGHHALSRLLAKVEAVESETTDTLTFRLRPNRHWRGFTAGQHVAVSVELDGRRLQRSYSLSSDPADRSRIAITVKLQPGGRVSAALHNSLRKGDVLRLGQAAGDFALPAVLPQSLLMIGAGSGVTPLRSMLYALRNAGWSGELVFLQICRDGAHSIFGAELDLLASEWPSMKLIRHASATLGRPDLAAVLSQVPDYRLRHTLLCGPEAFMRPLREHWSALGLSDRLRWERYGITAEPMGDDQPREIACTASGLRFQAAPGEPLLLAAERAGLTPDYGCRKGICHSCRYRKTGRVRNLLTGERCAEPGVLVQLCVCVAESAVELEDL